MKRMADLRLLEYLEKQGPTNTFRLASDLRNDLGLDRGQLLDTIRRLEAKGALTVKSGVVQFLEYPQERKEVFELKKEASPSEPKRRNIKPKIIRTLQSENTQLKEKLTALKRSIEELEKKASAQPKTITRTVTKTIIKKIRSPPKIITRTVIKKVPVIKTVIRRIQVPGQPAETKVREKRKAQSTPFTKKVWQKLSIQSKKLKMPKFTLLKNIQRLKKPEFVK